MAFWSTGETEPKRNFRFQVQITGLTGGNDVLWWAKTVTTPSFDISETEHDYLDNKYYFPGRVTWNEVSLTLVDPISIDAVSQTNTLLEGHGYVIPNKGDSTAANLSTLSKNKGKVALGDITITVYNSLGEPIETWTLNNPFLKSAKYGDLDYSSDDLRTIEMTIRYDWATCETDNTFFPTVES